MCIIMSDTKKHTSFAIQSVVLEPNNSFTMMLTVFFYFTHICIVQKDADISKLGILINAKIS